MPRHRHVRRGGLFDRPVQLLAGVAVTLLLGWVWLVASVHIHEMIVGVVVVALSTAFCALVLRSTTLPLDLQWRDVLQVRHVPAEILADAWIVTAVLFRDLFGIERAGSHYRVSGFAASRRDPVLVAREALATTYTTLSPNVIVVGIDTAQGHMLFHQLRQAEVSNSSRGLGAGA